jgi:hypothetical protein
VSDEACFYCDRTRPIENGTYTLMDFGHRLGIQACCDDCRQRGEEAETYWDDQEEDE